MTMMYEDININGNTTMLLSEGAKEFLKNNAVIIGKRVLQDVMETGRVIEVESVPIYDKKEYTHPKQDEWGSLSFIGYINLYEYKLKDGGVVREVVHVWSHEIDGYYNPHLALKDEHGNWIKESKWDEDNFDVVEMHEEDCDHEWDKPNYFEFQGEWKRFCKNCKKEQSTKEYHELEVVTVTLQPKFEDD